MSYYDGTNRTLHEVLTQLLMDNGAAVTKKSVDELIKFLAARDHEIVSGVIRDAERQLARLQSTTVADSSNEP